MLRSKARASKATGRTMKPKMKNRPKAIYSTTTV
jgi:hypothetical protein